MHSALRELEGGREPEAKSERVFRVAYLVSHPIQYQAPLLRSVAADPRVDLEVFFLSDHSARVHYDRGFEARFAWDVPLLDGYDSTPLSQAPRVSFARPYVSDVWSRIESRIEGGFDALWVHGWSQLTLLRAIHDAASSGVPVLLRGESLPGRRGPLRRWALREVLARAAGVLAVGEGNAAFYEEHGVDRERIFSCPYAVDEAFFAEGARRAAEGRDALRDELGLTPGRPVILCVAKLVGKKRPGDLLRAHRRLVEADPARAPFLLFAGDGPLRSVLEARSGESVRFLGFQNQSRLPALYDLSDVVCLPSAHELWGLVINEAMSVGRAVVASDACGAARDLVHDGRTGRVFPAGDVQRLTQVLGDVLADPEGAERMGRAGRERVRAYSIAAAREGLVEALSEVCA